MMTICSVPNGFKKWTRRIFASVISAGCLVGAVSACAQQTVVSEPNASVYVLDLWKIYEQEGFDSLEKQVNATYFITALQGIVNRDESRLFLDAAVNLIGVELDSFHIKGRDKQADFESMDRRWLAWLQQSGLLGQRPVVEIESVKDLLSVFADEVNGLALWDMETPSSVNLALTAAGCEDLLPLSADLDDGFLQQRIAASGISLPVVQNFTGYASKAAKQGITGKELIYRTMLDLYLKSGKASPYHLWYNLDAFTWNPPVVSYGGNKHLGNRNILQHNGLYNGDYWISQRGLFVDLYPLDDAAPNDDLRQVPGTDLRLWNDLLEESYRQRDGAFGVMGGFAPWWVKYTDAVGNAHPPIDAEQAFIRLATSYNLWNDADAAFGLSNASFYRHLPLPKPSEFTNPAVEKPELKKDTIYVCLFMLDHDGSAWLNQIAHTIYDRPGRGTVPLNWAINPLLSDRVPHVFRYLLENRTEQDFFRIGDDGAGYVDPYYLVGSNRTGRIKEDGYEAYCQAAKPYLDRLNMDLMAFYISDQEFTEEILAPIAALTPAGMGLNRTATLKEVAGVPVKFAQAYHHRDKAMFTSEMARLFERAGSGLIYPEFYAYRLILFRPSMVADVVTELRKQHPAANIEFLDAHTFMSLKQEGDKLPLTSPWMHKKRLEARAGEGPSGLEPVRAGDGAFAVVKDGDASVWRLAPSAKSPRYFYVTVDDAFSKENELADDLQVRIALSCDAPVTVGLQYNSMWPAGDFPNPYKAHPKKTRQSPGEAQEIVFKLDRPYFKNSQNAMADFRVIISGQGTVDIESMILEHDAE
ncbi:GxGYxYP domain-containing protein [Tichowtungia aerotolerans]|uniref:GxGYxYP putative glycoside hydrolase C-terminal domain-containing protein n=1 Tax=Tichowtungia aerotolerans TaxID=2697043 RepID=A0A6P1M2D0_9BACT|nr:GxGYxYP domain-containing protein [Tichowtungia aerotolerans]QHI68001.1 hypothetical protein GT409_00560 [Tichowtungia aerotolerans]